MNILVLEDEKSQRDVLVRIIEKNFLDSRVYSSESLAKARKLLKEKKFDLFLLDIEVLDGSGIDFAKEIRKIDKYKLTGIVFITANLIHMLEAFKEIHCYDFLIKPYNEKNVLDIIKLFENNNDSIEKEGKYVMFNIEGAITTKVYVEDIIYIEYDNRSCKVRTKNEIVLVKGSGLSKILKEISSDEIVQCHKAFAVNKKYIEKIARINNKMWDIYFWNCENSIPLGYKYKNDVMDGLA